MSKYRIVENKGTYTSAQIEAKKNAKILNWRSYSTDLDIYIPRFIIQEEKGHSNLGYWFSNPYLVDLKEFNNLEEARAYKRELELDEGIVRD